MSVLGFLIELVTDLVVDSDGNATCKGAGDHELGPTVGWHFGFYSRPNDGARGLVIKADGEGNTSFLIAFRDKQYEMSLEKGECGMQNAFSASVLLNKNGEIVLNGGSKKVARVDDTLTASMPLGAWAGVVEGAINSAAPGTFVPANQFSTTVGITGGLGKIATGAPKVLG